MNLRHAAPVGTAVCSGLLWVTGTAAPAFAQTPQEPSAAEAAATETEPGDTTATERSQDAASQDATARDATAQDATARDAASQDAASQDVGSPSEAGAETEARASASIGAEASAEATARAEVQPAEPEPAPTTVPSPTADRQQKAAEASQVPLASFEVLPPGAYPEPKVRGIPGGSLKFDMQGHQWPYLPKQADGPAARVGFSGSVWVDNAWRRADSNADVAVQRWIQQGRGVLRLSPTYSWDDHWFIQAQGEAVLNSDQTQDQTAGQPDTDDLWVRFGKWKQFDIQVGRYQAWEVYHLGMGLDLNTFERRGAATDTFTPIQLYNVGVAWDRPSGFGNIAAHIYPLDCLRVEVLGQLGNATAYNALAARPAAILDLGFIKARGALEYKVESAAREEGDEFLVKHKGGGGSVQAVFDPWVEFGFNYGRLLVDRWNVDGGEDILGSFTEDSMGGFANARPIEDVVVGGGVNWTRWNNLQISRRNPGHYEEQEHLQTYGAAQYLLFKTLYIKAVFAYSKAKYEPSDADPTRSTGTSARLRLMYVF